MENRCYAPGWGLIGVRPHSGYHYDLMSWLSLSVSQVEGRSVRLRFVPDMFMHEHESPVVEVLIEDAEQPDQVVELVARFREDFIVDLEVTEQELHLVGEMDYEEIVIRESRVQSSQASYSNEELLAIAVSFQKTLQKETSHSYIQSAKLKDIRHFVADLIDRAEKKRSLSGKAVDSVEAQLSVLSRVLHRLDDA